MRYQRVLFMIILFTLLISPISTKLLPQSPSNCEILFVDGKVLDGTGNPWFYADVAVTGDKIVAVGDLKGKITSQQTINIKGKILVPGFIDIHTHAYDRVVSDKVWQGENEKRYFAPNFMSQGVTTLVSNHCGGGPPTLTEQSRVLAEMGTGPNVCLLIGHNSIRRHVLGKDSQRPATSAEILEMRKLVRQAMEEGAAGMSSGLEYVPSIWSTTEELVALVKEMVPYGGIFFAHERASGLSPMWYVPSQDEPGPPNMLDNILELIEVSEHTGGRVVAAHIKARGADFWGASQAIIQHINKARDRGVDIWADCYPYNSSGSDGRVVLIPSWALGRNFQESLRATLEDPEKKKSLYADIKHNINWRGGTENIIIMDFIEKSYIGKSISQAAQENGIDDIEMIIQLQLKGDPRTPGGARLRGFSMDEIDIEAFSAQPWTATASDASIALPGDGPVHARFYGTFPRKIRHYALERGVISLENAVRASTSLPAQILGLRDRGMIREGFHADLVVFDLDTIKDTATFFEPHQHAEGIHFVLVNGEFVVKQGELTWERPGRVLKK